MSGRSDRSPQTSTLAPVITALAGGVGAAKLLSGLVQVVDPSSIAAVVNVGDDADMHGLRVCPDLDTIRYTLGHRVNPETGWGRQGESWRVMGELERLGGKTWFRLGDLDLASHLFRTAQLADGHTLTHVSSALAHADGIKIQLLPATDDPLRTKVELVTGETIDFQTYFVRMRHAVEVRAVHFHGATEARLSPASRAALYNADQIVICPSNPIVSIGPLLAITELATILRERREQVVAVSPIVGGAALKGPADRLMRELGHESSVSGVAALYRKFASTLVIDERDAALAAQVEDHGLRCAITDTVMSDPARARALASFVTRFAPTP